MQLKRRRGGKVSQALGLLTANLLAVGLAHAQAASGPAGDTGAAPPSISDDDTSDAGDGSTRVDSSVLFYQEAGGRVRAIEPVVNATLSAEDGETLTLGFASDILTGATPNGAVPWNQSQTFITPARAPNKSASVTTASGGSTLVTIPGGLTTRQYTTAPNTLPVDKGFRDQRWAFDVGYSSLWDKSTRLSVGGAFSIERDYTSGSVNAGVVKTLNQNLTTLSASLDFEYDLSRPYFGTPTPFTVMSGNPKGPDASKTVVSAVLSGTQVMNRVWLAQLSYTIGTTNGYQADPYRVISVVDATSGVPMEYLYEGRPKDRLRQSLYLANKLAIGPTFADISARAYHDSWGINSVTVEASDRIPITSQLFIEPQGRYYAQTSASFFRNYLISGQALPQYASSDSRIGAFSAVTFGAKAGFNFTPNTELYVQGESYRQMGTQHPAGAIGGLANQNLFSGVSAVSVIAGFTFAFF
jgi:hypothetical protein